MTPPNSTDLPWEKILQLADLALLEAKQGGRDRAIGFFWEQEITASWDLDRVLRERDQAVSEGLLRRINVS